MPCRQIFHGANFLCEERKPILKYSLETCMHGMSVKLCLHNGLRDHPLALDHLLQHKR